MTLIERILTGEFINPGTLMGAIFYLLVFLSFAWLGSRAIGFVAEKLAKFHRGDHDLVDPTTVTFVRKLLQIAFYLVVITLYAHLIPELRSIGTVLLTGVSIVSIIIALAAQNTLGNVIAGISIILYRPFKAGDRLQIFISDKIETGEVESVTLGYTILKTFDNRRIVIPNSLMANQVIVNLTAKDPRLIATVPIGIGYTSDLRKARQILLELAKNHKLVQEVVDCPVTRLGDYSVTLSLRMWCANASDSNQIEYDLYEAAKERFDQEGIQIPFPTQNLIITKNND